VRVVTIVERILRLLVTLPAYGKGPLERGIKEVLHCDELLFGHGRQIPRDGRPVLHGVNETDISDLVSWSTVVIGLAATKDNELSEVNGHPGPAIFTELARVVLKVRAIAEPWLI
jgi:hypothetical protein